MNEHREALLDWIAERRDADATVRRKSKPIAEWTPEEWRIATSGEESAMDAALILDCSRTTIKRARRAARA